MIQAKVGPSILSGKDLSETPPDQRSISAGCLKYSVYFGFILWLICAWEKRGGNFTVVYNDHHSMDVCLINMQVIIKYFNIV